MKLPDYYEYSCRARILSGYKALEELGAKIRGFPGASKALIVTDRGVSDAGLVDLVKKHVSAGVTIAGIYTDVPPDSELAVVNKIADIYKQKGCDTLIAIGGGSVIDTAKGVNIVVSLGGDDIMSFCGVNRISKKLNPFVVIPTTSGTGSEATLVAVIGDHENHIKLVFISPFLIPDFAVLDPRMTVTLPPSLTAATGMDALSHAVEAYFCMGKNPMSDVTAFKAISLIFDNLLNVVKKPNDTAGRLALAHASNLAGIAFSNSMVGIVHNIGHAVGGICGVPHGNCMAILLPYGLEYNMRRSAGDIGELLYPMAGAGVYRETKPEERPWRVVELVRKMNDDLHKATNGRHPRFFKEVRDYQGNQMVHPGRFKEIISNCFDDPAIFYNPEEADADEYRMILELSYEGLPTDFKRIKK